MAKPVNDDDSMTVAIERPARERKALGRDIKRIDTQPGLAGL
jgi:hypothetical protein